ncbi:MAG: hypothetical protein WA126_13475, partial [Thermodesulfovibrionales bacterium]
RAKRGNLAFNKINRLEIASSQKLLLAMTCDGFFNSLSRADPNNPITFNVFGCRCTANYTGIWMAQKFKIKFSYCKVTYFTII